MGDEDELGRICYEAYIQAFRKAHPRMNVASWDSLAEKMKDCFRTAARTVADTVRS